MTERIDAVIFDMDGSLVDSMWIWKQIDIDYLSFYGYDVSDESIAAFQAKIEGMSFDETAEWVSEHYEIPRTKQEMMDDWNRMAWEKYEKEVFLKPGAKEFLDYCRNKGIKLGIASSNSRELIENVLSARKLEGVFDIIKTGSDGLPGKPAPDVYLAAAEELDVKPEHCLVFEDIPKGIRSGKGAGMIVCAVEDVYSMHQIEEKKRLADFYIEDYYDLFKQGIFTCQ
ncbi:MAG: HAD family phosphatase [Lachnospiraceae bacterium]|nr:HAD family phosphatase [Lachnospiraceae bacterium]